MKDILAIFPCAYGQLNKVDKVYLEEIEMAEEVGFSTLLFNFDDFVLGKELKLNKELIDKVGEYDLLNRVAIYRGWMLSPEKYTELYSTLLNTYNIQLINNPSEYVNTHCYINSYMYIKNYIHKMVWYDAEEKINWDVVRHNLGNKFIVSDYVKKINGWNFPEYLDSNIMSDDELNQYIDKFKYYRGNLYTGGIVLHQYTELDRIDDITHEFKIFYLYGYPFYIFNDSENRDDPKCKDFANLHELRSISSNFYMISVARLNDGTYTITSLCDANVATLGKYQTMQYNFYSYLYNILKIKHSKIQLNFYGEQVIQGYKSLYLAGPTTLEATFNESWRKMACNMLKDLGYRGIVYIPEFKEKVYHEESKDLDWDLKAFEKADIVLFYIPNNKIDNLDNKFYTDFGFILGKKPEKCMLCGTDTELVTKYMQQLYNYVSKDGVMYNNLYEALIKAVIILEGVNFYDKTE